MFSGIFKGKSFVKNKSLADLLSSFFLNNDGATALEYGLIIGFISLVLIGSLTTMGVQLTAVFTSLTSSLQTIASS
ncbi:Flp family type IVb pilin [Candidatus Nucleicultrix amoebiphila]|jgi:pilus assembly protein Flp/PilA|uniref:Flp family type IVb pilin n=1 Tax=Candidatus Nucleicultrix amoebiphila TaxID=1509244 RepID=UPI000A26CD65|nr:Flp family type IVb pilin [Candidatus Nucleicultrix amoebiphila]